MLFSANDHLYHADKFEIDPKFLIQMKMLWEIKTWLFKHIASNDKSTKWSIRRQSVSIDNRVYPQHTKLAMLAFCVLLRFENKLHIVISHINSVHTMIDYCNYSQFISIRRYTENIFTFVYCWKSRIEYHIETLAFKSLSACPMTSWMITNPVKLSMNCLDWCLNCISNQQQ